MRFTIERIRTLVVVAAVLLLAALGAFLVRAKWKNLLSRRDLPQRLGLGITEESNGYSYSHNLGAHSKYKIHAAKEIHLKNDHVELHDVVIEIYGEDGAQTDKIAGDEFEYDQKSGIASAKGPVEMMLTRPPGPAGGGKKPAGNGKKVDRSHTAAGAVGDTGQVQVKTSGVTFDRNTGVLTTSQRVDFTTTQGSGSAVGATYDSQRGYLTLVQAVELTTYRGQDAVQIRAQHAEFDRGAQLCLLRAATMDYRDGQANAVQAKILFRNDGSAARLEATGGFVVTTSTGGRLASPTAAMDFDEHSQPRHGHLEGGVTLDSKQEGASAQEGRTMHGTSPTAELDFTAQGQLRHAHLERGVTMQSEASSLESGGQTLHVSRTWRSPVADVNFRTIKGGGQGGGQTAGKTQVEPETIHGTGGVVITSESRRGHAAAVPAKMTADEVTGTFGAGAALRTLVGTGHAEMEQTTATGAQQRAGGDRLEASFAEDREQGSKGAREQESRERGSKGAREQESRERGSVLSPVSKSRPGAPNSSGTTGAPDVQSAELDGHVTLFEQPAAKPGAQPQPPLRGTAGKAVYEGAGEWLHLTLNPRIVNGGLELTADKVDVSRQSDEAFAHGNVKATWTGGESTGGGNKGGAAQGSVALGGNGPAHVIAAEAQMNQATSEATFRGHARLWQQANSVAAPEIVLNQQLQTLTARTTDAAEPVRAVLLSQGAPGAGIGEGNTHGQGAAGNAAAKPATPSVVRVRGGDLKYSAAEHRAVMHGGVAGAVVAETGTATSTSDTVELLLIPAGKGDSGPAQGGQAQSAGGQAQVDRMTATGHVVLVSEGRRGTGEELVYSGATGDYVLTGTAAARPRMTDPGRGNVTGEVLIFHSRDDSVSIEGGGQQTRTETTAPQAHGR